MKKIIKYLKLSKIDSIDEQALEITKESLFNKIQMNYISNKNTNEIRPTKLEKNLISKRFFNYKNFRLSDLFIYKKFYLSFLILLIILSSLFGYFNYFIYNQNENTPTSNKDKSENTSLDPNLISEKEALELKEKARKENQRLLAMTNFPSTEIKKTEKKINLDILNPKNNNYALIDYTAEEVGATSKEEYEKVYYIKQKKEFYGDEKLRPLLHPMYADYVDFSKPVIDESWYGYGSLKRVLSQDDVPFELYLDLITQKVRYRGGDFAIYENSDISKFTNHSNTIEQFKFEFRFLEDVINYSPSSKQKIYTSSENKNELILEKIDEDSEDIAYCNTTYIPDSRIKNWPKNSRPVTHKYFFDKDNLKLIKTEFYFGEDHVLTTSILESVEYKSRKESNLTDVNEIQGKEIISYDFFSTLNNQDENESLTNALKNQNLFKIKGENLLFDSFSFSRKTIESDPYYTKEFDPNLGETYSYKYSDEDKNTYSYYNNNPMDDSTVYDSELKIILNGKEYMANVIDHSMDKQLQLANTLEENCLKCKRGEEDCVENDEDVINEFERDYKEHFRQWVIFQIDDKWIMIELNEKPNSADTLYLEEITKEEALKIDEKNSDI